MKALISSECEMKSWVEIVRYFKPDATEDEIEFILWEQTCYPFSHEATIQQLNELFKAE
jgi:hypothetical protein